MSICLVGLVLIDFIVNALPIQENLLTALTITPVHPDKNCPVLRQVSKHLVSAGPNHTDNSSRTAAAHIRVGQASVARNWV